MLFDFIFSGSKTEYVVLCNRAFCHLKMENYGFAIVDADQVIKLAPDFTKGYYRKGQAQLMMSKFDEARDSFKIANKLTGGKDKDIVDKLAQIKKVIFEREFFKSIEMPEDKFEKIDVNSLEVPANYDGPRYEDEDVINADWCVKLMNYLKDQKRIHKKYLVKLLHKSREILAAQSSIVEWPIPK